MNLKRWCNVVISELFYSQGASDSDLSPPASAPQPAIHDDDEEEEEDGIEGNFMSSGRGSFISLGCWQKMSKGGGVTFKF